MKPMNQASLASLVVPVLPATGEGSPPTVRFAVPEILGARDTTNQDWAQTAIDWTKSLLALRPAEEMEGDSPEAVVSRLEGAMERRDYATALSLIDALPPAMRDKATLVATDIRAHAEAAKLVADLRARALTTTTADTQ